MSSLFGVANFDTSDIPEGPKAGVYNGVCKKVELFATSAKGNTHHVFHFQVLDPSFDFLVRSFQGFPTLDEMRVGPAMWDDATIVDTKQGLTQRAANLQKLRRFNDWVMRSFDIPKERVNQIKDDDFIGMPVVLTIEINGEGYPSIKRVDPPKESHTALPPAPTVMAQAPSVTPAPTAPPVVQPVNPAVVAAAPVVSAPVSQVPNPYAQPVAAGESPFPASV